MLENTKKTTPKKSKRATDADIAKRMTIIEEYLNELPSLEEQPSRFKDDEWEIIKKNGIDINQFHTVMCGNPTNTTDLGVLGEKLSMPNLKRLLKNHGYEWNPYVVKPISDKESIIIECILNYFQDKSKVKIYLECIENTINTHLDKPLKPQVPDQKFCISIYFKNAKYTSIIAEHLYDLFNENLLGIISGLGVIQIYIAEFDEAQSMYKQLRHLIFKGIYKEMDIDY